MQRTPSGADTPNHDRTGSSDMSDAKAKLKALKQSLVQTGEKMKQSIKKGLESLAADEDFDHDPSENIDSPPAVLTPVNGGGSTGSAMEDAKFERMNSSERVPTLTPKKSFNSEDAKILETIRAERFSKLIEETDVDMTKIRKLCWSSIPAQHRPLYWPVLLGVLPFNKARRETIVDKRIKEYMWFCKIHQDNWPDKYTVEEMKSFKQIELDIPRTAPRANMFFHQRMEKALSRVLTIYSIRHPATGYVQGMNDVVIPWLWIFATECTQKFEDEDKSEAIDRMDRLSEDHWNAIEAKTFWCFSRAVESIQDHYTRDQPGIQKKLFQLKQLMGQIDPELNTYLEEAGITYHMFAYRWMNCFLVRELPLRHVVRVWDTYFSEEELGFTVFHVYFCASLLNFISPQVKACSQDLERAISILQECKDVTITDKDLDEMMSQAYIYQSKHNLP